jgi:outer membrane cobalamin receptor
LKGFPCASITKIEVITTPSAKYDAEGVGGVINIITKKKVVGYNGSINTYYSNTGWKNLNINFSAKFGKVGVTLYYGANGATKIPGNQGWRQRLLCLLISAGDYYWVQDRWTISGILEMAR